MEAAEGVTLLDTALAVCVLFLVHGLGSERYPLVITIIILSNSSRQSSKPSSFSRNGNLSCPVSPHPTWNPSAALSGFAVGSCKPLGAPCFQVQTWMLTGGLGGGGLLSCSYVSDFLSQVPKAPPEPSPLPPHGTRRRASALPGLPSPLPAVWHCREQPHLGRFRAAVTKPGSAEGRLITQLINPTDVILSAHFFVIWWHVAHIAAISSGFCWKNIEM